MIHAPYFKIISQLGGTRAVIFIMACSLSEQIFLTTLKFWKILEFYTDLSYEVAISIF